MLDPSERPKTTLGGPMKSLASVIEMLKGPADGLVPFSLGELWGPARCEHDGCEKQAWTIWMTPAEYELAREQDVPTLHVFNNKIGTARCDKHRPGKV